VARRPPESVEEEIQKTRPHISLDYSTYAGRHTKARFIDSEHGEYWMTPGNALKGQEHPARKLLKQRQTSLERYGTENPFQSEEVKNRARKKNQERYGADWYMQTEDFRSKSKETCLKNWGQERYPVENERSYDYKDHGEKVKKAVFARYGVNSTALLPEVKERQIATCWERYGGETSLASAEVRRKQAVSRKKNNKLENDFHKIFPNLEKNRWFRISGKTLELDFFDAKSSIGIELCGEYWHSDKFIHKNRHLEKLKMFEEIGVQVLFVFQEEWIQRRAPVISYLRSKLGMFQKTLGARQTRVEKIDSKKAALFCDRYHIQGRTTGNNLNVALTSDSEIVAVACFGRGHRQQNADEWFLKRLCFKEGVRINGGLQKLTSAFFKETGEEKLFTFIDKRFSRGDAFFKNGWKHIRTNRPDYFYFDGRHHVSKQSRKKKNTHTPQNMTEYEHAQADGLVRVWDCGKMKLEKSR
jgi:hypothetical protein